jgi:peptidoglycan/LPS O-acetylase OafA/YrhL
VIDTGRLGHRPALDGLRGLAVLAVLLFHGGFPWASGGYLGVSVFFTLSGFLITRLMLEERAAHGRVSVRRFSVRRVRRLAPASAVTLVAVILAAGLGAWDGVNQLRRDIVGAALQVENWTRLLSSRTYADLFDTGASPVEHFWSLGVEVQFYLVWPLVFLALARRSRDALRGAVVGLFVVFAVAAPVIAWVWGSEAAYLATPARLAEILAGAVLAVALDPDRPRRGQVPVAVLAAATIVVLVIATPADHGWAYEGGLPLFGVLSALVVAGALVDGPVRTVLAWRPLVAVGTISYGLYLVHWPIFLLVDEHLSNLAHGWRFALQAAVSFLVAAVLFLAVERPIHRHPMPRGTVAMGLAAVAAVTVLAVVVVPGSTSAVSGVDEAAAEAARIAPAPNDLGPVGDGQGGLRRPVRILLVGDSTGDAIGAGLVDWAAAHPDRAQVQVSSIAGCGMVQGGRFDDLAVQNRERCDEAMHSAIPASYPKLRPDVVVISIAAADTWDRRWGDGPQLRPTDPAYAARIRAGYDSFVEAAVAAGVPDVVWLRPPIVGLEPSDYDPSYVDGSQEIVERVVRDAAARHPDIVSIVDFRSWFERAGLARDADARPDGVHVTPDLSAEIAEDFLGPRLVTIAAGAPAAR